MDIYRLKHTFFLCLLKGSFKRAEYIKKHRIFAMVGNDCSFMPRIIPLYPQLIKLHNNVKIASKVTLITHDVSHTMLNSKYNTSIYKEKIGCIEIEDNCYIGMGVIILPNVKIGPNTIVAAGAIITKDLPGNGIYAGVPARRIEVFEQYVKKRYDESVNSFPIDHPRGNSLSLDTLRAAWQQFNKSKGNL